MPECRNPDCRAALREGEAYCCECGWRSARVAPIVHGSVNVPLGAECRIPVSLSANLNEGVDEWISVQLRASIPALGRHAEMTCELSRENSSATVHLSLGALFETARHQAQVQVEVPGALPWVSEAHWGCRQPERRFFNVDVYAGILQLVAEPRVLVFRHKDERIPVKVHPPHGTQIGLNLPDPGTNMGFWPSNPNTEPATCERPMIFEASCLVESPGFLGEVLVQSVDEAWECRIPGYLIETRHPAPPPQVVYAIDFGTSNTSIVRRNFADGGHIVEIGPPRFPSAVYIKHPEAPRTWLYGELAISRAEADRHQGDQPGHLILNLKTAIRSPSLSQSFERLGLSPRGVLTEYFKKLLSTYICRDLQHLGEPDPSQVCFVFTVPVLDNESGMESQRNETLEAAREAGFENYGFLHWCREPEAAMLEALSGRLEGRNADVVIVDSGAGTTDIAMAKVVPDGHGLRFDDLQSFSIRCPEAKSREELPDEQVGGEALTLLLAVAMAKQWLETNRPEQQHSEGAQQEATRWLMQVAAGAERRPQPLATLPDNVIARNFPDDQDGWHKRYTLFVRRLDELKQVLANGNGIPHLEGLPDKYPYKRVFERAVERLGNFLNDGLAHLNLDPPITPKLLFVGGNSQVGKVREVFEACFAGATVIDVEKPLLAVARGATRLYDVQNELAPYGVRVRMELPDKVPATITVDTGQPIDNRQKTLPTIPLGQTGKFHVEIKCSDTWHPVASPLEIKADTDHIFPFGKIQKDRAILTFKFSGTQSTEEIKLP